jgi:PAS domain S-box-containing protein
MGRISRRIVDLASVLVVAILALDVVLVLTSRQTILRNRSEVDHLRQVVAETDRVLSSLSHVETGHRGYLLTGRDDDLKPFRDAESELGAALDRLGLLAEGDGPRRERAAELARLAKGKMVELRRTADLRREKGLEAALELARDDRVEDAMDRARRLGAELRAEAVQALNGRVGSSRRAIFRTLATFGLAALTALGLLAVVQVLWRREEKARRKATEVLAEQKRLAEFGRDMGFALTGSASLRAMLTRCAEVTVRHLDGAFARIWTLDESGTVLELQASSGLYTHTDGPHGRVPLGRYKVGRIALERKSHLTNAVIGDPSVPDQDWAEREGMVAFAGYPLVVEDRLVGVWAMFARHPLSEAALGAMESVANGIAAGIERKRAAEALADSEAWLSTTLSSIGDAVIATDREGLVRFMNPVAEGLTGWVQRDAAGRPIDEVFRIVNEQTGQPVEHPVARVVREGATVGLANHTVLIARGGSRTPIEDSAAPIRDGRGAIAGVVMVFRDVTRERAAQVRLRESEARKAAILETALDAIITVDHEGKVLEFNPAAERIFGHAPGQAIGRVVSELIIPPSLREAHNQGQTDYLATGEGPILGNRIELPARRADGSRFPAEVAVTRITTEGPPLFTAHVRDISERKRVEAERLRLISIIEHSPDFIGLADPCRRMLFVNRAGRRLVGLGGEDEVRGTSILDYFPEDQRDRVEREVLPVLLERGHWDGEVWFTNFKTGGRTPVLWNVFTLPDPESGAASFFACVSRDITERKLAEKSLQESERQFRTLADSIPHLAWMAGSDGSISWFNKRWYDYTGTAPGQTEGWAWRSVHSPDELPRVLAKFMAAIADGETWEDTFPLRRHDGAMRWHLSRAVPVRDETGRVVRWFGTNTDITEQQRAAEELKAARDEAEDANRAKDQFLAVLSHELRTPLNPILLAVTSMLERPTSPEDVRPNLEMIRLYVNLQARLIDDLLDVMRIVRGKMPLHWEVADCHSLIRQAIQVCRSEVLGKVLRLELDLAAEHHHINADPARLQQVFWNLLKNAVKFTPEGGAVTIRTRNQGDGDHKPGAPRLIIEVSDTGIGIEPGMVAKVFDPFQQGESSITRRFGGLGLGLAISKGIVEGHGGLLTAESAGESRGSTFRVELPALPVPKPGEDGRSRDGAPAGATEPQSCRKILLVEDEQATLRLMAKLLSGLGHQVTTAGTITSALEEERRGDFDLIVSDVGLPDGSGLELMRQVVARRGPVPAIALTGYGMEDDIQRSRDAGFTAHMTKPIDFTKLEAMIRQVAP